MPVMGRPLKPEGTTVHRNPPTHQWIEVEDVPFENSPDLPTRATGEKWPIAIYKWWSIIRKMPHCALWDDAEWQYAVDTAEIKALWIEEHKAAWATEARRREAVMGTTADARRNLRIRYVPKKASKTPADGSNVTPLYDYGEL